ncbi:MAG: hypothetical protein AAF958_06535 [Planctomycetota bacterium]
MIQHTNNDWGRTAVETVHVPAGSPTTIEQKTATVAPRNADIAPRDVAVAPPTSTPNTASDWTPGQWAIFRKSKRSTQPGPRASRIQASSKGDSYSYVVDKFWVVSRVLGDRLELRTASGKLRELAADDPNLRKPTFIERWLWRDRFRRVEQGQKVDSDAES